MTKELILLKVLAFLINKTEASAYEIANAIGFRAVNIIEILEGFKYDGWVKIRIDESARRKHYYTLTEKGFEVALSKMRDAIKNSGVRSDAMLSIASSKDSKIGVGKSHGKITVKRDSSESKQRGIDNKSKVFLGQSNLVAFAFYGFLGTGTAAKKTETKLSPTLKRQLKDLFGNDTNWWLDDFNKNFGATNREVIQKGHTLALEQYLERQLRGIPN